MMWRSSAAEMKPLPSLSKTRKASCTMRAKDRYGNVPSYEEEAGASRGGGGEESDAEGGAPEVDSPPTKQQRPPFVWTHEMHLRFERAVFQLGVPHARPLAIRRLMGCEGEEGAPTRDTIKSHLRYYRHKWEAAVAYARTAGQAGGEAGPSAPAEDGFDPADTAAAVSLAALRPAAFCERAEGGEAAGAAA